MKASFVSLIFTLATVVSAFERGAPHFTIPVVGWSEQSVFDFGEGWASGWFRKNETDNWGPCIEGIPNFILEVVDVVPHDNIIGDTTTLFNNLIAGDFSAISTGAMNKVYAKKEKLMHMVTEVPAMGVSCTAVGLDIAALVIFIVKHITIQTVTVSLALNASQNALGLAATAMSMVKDLVTFNFWGIGHGVGEILFYLFKD